MVVTRQFQNIWLKETIDQRKLTKKSSPNDNIMNYDICYLIIELLLNTINQLNYEQK